MITPNKGKGSHFASENELSHGNKGVSTDRTNSENTKTKLLEKPSTKERKEKPEKHEKHVKPEKPEKPVTS